MDWTVGRGRFGTLDGVGDNHVDRFFGFIDEVRISNAALPQTSFLASFSAADSDGYGFSNLEEYRAGSNPNSTASTPDDVKTLQPHFNFA